MTYTTKLTRTVHLYIDGRAKQVRKNLLVTVTNPKLRISADFSKEH